MRRILLTVHRWAGLTIALALVITGLTGAVIPYQDQLRSLLAPEVWNVAPPAPGARTLSGLELASKVEQATGGEVSFLSLVADPDHAHSIFANPVPGGPQFEDQQFFVDPYTGEIRAKVRFAELADGRINIVPFLVSVHYSLGAGQTGQLIIGVASLIWVVMSVIGLVLTLPHWRSAWRIRRNRGSRIFTFDLHRAAGLWFWPVSFVFAWSGVAFNLDHVHAPVQRLLGAEGLYQSVENPSPKAGEPMSREQAVLTGERLMAQEAALRGFTVRGPEALSLRSYSSVIGYYARTSLDGPSDNGSTAIWFDQVSGEKVVFQHPFGSTGADAIDKTFRMLHTGDLFGTAYKLFISVFALVTAVMAAAGVLVWWRKTGRATRSSEQTREVSP